MTVLDHTVLLSACAALRTHVEWLIQSSQQHPTIELGSLSTPLVHSLPSCAPLCTQEAGCVGCPQPGSSVL